jgi:hypothetical protein
MLKGVVLYMSGLVFGGIAPHGSSIIGEISEYCRGTLSQYGSSVSTVFKCDKAIALDILSRIEAEEYDL